MVGDRDLEKLLAPRVLHHGAELHKSGHHRHAAREAMVLVEKALKEKGRIEDVQFGIRLIRNLLGSG